jgi:pyrroloquinoline-quinone synthase
MQLRERLERRISSRHLLDHPFYQRWSAGTLSRAELEEYARQYWHFTAAFPTFVSGVHTNTDDLEARQLLLENLIEEERGPENHPELWLRFCDALGLNRADVLSSTPNDSTRALISTMHELTREGATHEGLSAMFAYESQVPAVAKAKIDGLRQWFAISEPHDIAFFTVHEEADVYHSQTAGALIDRICDSEAKELAAEAATARTLDALYGFLDSVNLEECRATA